MVNIIDLLSRIAPLQSNQTDEQKKKSPSNYSYISSRFLYVSFALFLPDPQWNFCILWCVLIVWFSILICYNRWIVRHYDLIINRSIKQQRPSICNTPHLSEQNDYWKKCSLSKFFFQIESMCSIGAMFESSWCNRHFVYHSDLIISNIHSISFPSLPFFFIWLRCYYCLCFLLINQYANAYWTPFLTFQSHSKPCGNVTKSLRFVPISVHQSLGL